MWGQDTDVPFRAERSAVSRSLQASWLWASVLIIYYIKHNFPWRVLRDTLIYRYKDKNISNKIIYHTNIRVTPRAYDAATHRILLPVSGVVNDGVEQ